MACSTGGCEKVWRIIRLSPTFANGDYIVTSEIESSDKECRKLRELYNPVWIKRMSCAASDKGGDIVGASCVENGPRSLDVDQEFTTFMYAKENNWIGTGPAALFKGDHRLTNKDIDRVWSERACTTKLTLSKL